MSPARRAQYLQAIGIDRWIPRIALGEAASPAPEPSAPAGESCARPGPDALTQTAPEARWQALRAEILQCKKCPLHEGRTQGVVGVGNREADWMVIGEAPGAEEDRQGVPFVGRSGAILDKAVASLGDDLGPYGVLNVVKCRPPANRFDPGAARACRPYLDRQLELLAPEFLVPLGAKALRALAPEAPPILRTAGQELASRYGVLFPLVHPAATLRSRRLAERWQDDLGLLHAWLRGRPLQRA